MTSTSSATSAAAGSAAPGVSARVVSVTSLCAATHSLKAGDAPTAAGGAAGAAMDGPAAAACSSSGGGSAAWHDRTVTIAKFVARLPCAALAPSSA